MKRIANQIIVIAVLHAVFFGVGTLPDHFPAWPTWLPSILTPGPPSPIKADGFRAYIFEETGDRHKLKPGQFDAITSTAPGSVRDYCEKHAAKVDGAAEFRVLDVNSSLEQDTPATQEAGKLPRTSTPWLIATNGKTYHSGPLPETVSETLEILTKYGGK